MGLVFRKLEKGRPMRRLRGFASILLALSFVGVAVTGLMMWIPALMPSVGKRPIETIHLHLSILLMVAAIVHVVFNARALLAYVAGRVQGPRLIGETIVATILVIGLTAAALLAPEPPEMKFLRASPAQIAERSGLSKAEVIALFKKDGLAVGDGQRPLLVVCRESQVSPHWVIEHVRKEHPALLGQ